MIQTKDLVEQDSALREADFYAKKFRFSFTSLSRLLESPKEFYREYIMKDREIKRDRHLVLGTLTHFLSLEHVNFDDHFAVSPEGVPTGNAQEIIETIYKIYDAIEDKDDGAYELEFFEDEILEEMRELNYWQQLKDDKKAPHLTGDQKRLAKVLEPKNINYFEFLKNSQRKELVDGNMLSEAAFKADIIKSDPKICELMGIGKEHDGENYGIYNEHDLEMEVEGLPFGVRGKLDNIFIDVANKTIYINDLKTTGGRVQDFQDSVEKWNYWLQAAIYTSLVQEFLKDAVGDDWEMVFHFIVIDRYNQAYPFPVSHESMIKWLNDMNDEFGKAAYHYTKREYALPYEFIAGEIKL
jgi:hypothetical protein